MAVFDVVKWNASDSLYAWKFPSEELSTATQLIVAESQEAVLLRGGQMLGPFGPGRHTLSTENIPLLRDFVKIPFGGRSPFTAEVWFVNLAIPLDVKWGTSDPIQVLDPQYKIMLPVRAFGQFGVQIEQSKKFLIKLVGSMPSFNRDQLISYFRGLMLTRTKDLIARKMVKESVSVLEISAHLNAISTELQTEMTSEFAEFGLKLTKFFVNSINTPEDDPAVIRLKGALAHRAEMNIVGFTYQQERSFNTLDSAASNPGSSSDGIMGAGIGLGIGMNVGSAMGSAMGNLAQNINTNVTCAKCQAVNPASARFCSGCGQTLGPPPVAAPSDTIACASCGTKVAKGARFCSNCGKPMAVVCKCGTTLPPEAKFCPQCGTPRDKGPAT